jgi:hypothetical protein
MDWRDSVKAVRRAAAAGQLVIFVGSGVSANSGLPTWKEMILKIAERLPADFNSDAPFNPDTYLRIPEYLYEQDLSPNHQYYYQTIGEILSSDAPANPIDDLIFDIRPHHIITTNADALLERSASLNTRLYAVVSKDADLLSKSSQHYLIKMHGDIQDPETVVVKESDYLDYEQNHPLLSTFIRSLLINHTFLFIGYSLNDYNLNLILNWIHFFRKQLKVKRRPDNFLVQTKTPSPYEVRRLECRDMTVVDLNTLPDVILRRAAIPQSLTAPYGRRLYAYLATIADKGLFQTVLPLGTALSEALEPLKSYNRIAPADLLAAFDFGPAELVNTTLILKDPALGKRLAPVLTAPGPVRDAFSRAGITAVSAGGETTGLPPYPDDPVDAELKAAYLDNRYEDLRAGLEDASPAAKIAWGWLLGEDVSGAVAKERAELDPGDAAAFILHALRACLAGCPDPPGTTLPQILTAGSLEGQPGTGFVRALFTHAPEAMGMLRDRDRLEDVLRDPAPPKNQGAVAAHVAGRLFARARSAYFFILDNHLPFPMHSAEAYFKYAIQGLLCLSASPYKRPWDAVDLDLASKGARPRELARWLVRYAPGGLVLEDPDRGAALYANRLAAQRAFPNLSFAPLESLGMILARTDLPKPLRAKLRDEGLITCLAALTRSPDRAGEIFGAAKPLFASKAPVPDGRKWHNLLTQPAFRRLHLPGASRIAARLEQEFKQA